MVNGGRGQIRHFAREPQCENGEWRKRRRLSDRSKEPAERVPFAVSKVLTSQGGTSLSLGKSGVFLG